MSYIQKLSQKHQDVYAAIEALQSQLDVNMDSHYNPDEYQRNYTVAINKICNWYGLSEREFQEIELDCLAMIRRENADKDFIYPGETAKIPEGGKVVPLYLDEKHLGDIIFNALEVAAYTGTTLQQEAWLKYNTRMFYI